MKTRNLIPALWLAAAAFFIPLASAQEGRGDVVYVPTPQIVVDEMLGLAKITSKDYLIDLGSGDGRFVITAAKVFGARAMGVDLDTYLLGIARKNAKEAGVDNKVVFLEQNLFETSIEGATVISSYLLPEMNLRLRPKILALPPGTRVVAHDYHMGDWYPDDQKTLSVPEKKVGNPGVSYLYLWYVPAKVAGRWESTVDGTKYEFDLNQLFQNVTGTVKAGAAVGKFASKVKGEDVTFLVARTDGLARHEFTGKIAGDTMTGTVKIGEGAQTKTVPWSAKLATRRDVARPGDEIAGR